MTDSGEWADDDVSCAFGEKKGIKTGQDTAGQGWAERDNSTTLWGRDDGGMEGWRGPVWGVVPH